MREPVPSGAPAQLRPHRLDVDFGPRVPRHWLGGRRVDTAMLNALGILFPVGERFFARTAREALRTLEDRGLAEQVKGFVAQEIHHAFQHERSFASVEAHGYPARELTARVERFVEQVLEPTLSLKQRAAVTAALEHFTAVFAEFAFAKGVLEDASPQMRELFLWHAAEEIEHKCVAFDLLQQLDDGYGLRLFGMCVAGPLLVSLWYGVAAALLAHETPKAPVRTVAEWLRSAAQGRFAIREIFVAVGDYVRPGFHPAQEDNFQRARDYFAARPA